MDLSRNLEQISDEIKENRRFLHMHPEPGNREFETSAFIEEKLKSYGIETQRLLDTAVIGTLKFSEGGKTIALRADMDALPVSEETGCAFSSLNKGYMHACGHDVHMSAALGAARLLSGMRGSIKGTVKFIFQPDEEGDGGAKRLVDCGVMNGVDVVFGAHVSPDIPVGFMGVRYGKFYAASDVFKITVKGKSSHGAEPEKGIDAIYAAAILTEKLLRLPKECYPDRAVVTVGKFNAGTAVNILAGEAVLEGIIRTLGKKNRTLIKKKMRAAADKVEEICGVHIDIHIKESYPGIVNSDDVTMYAEMSAVKAIGMEKVLRLEHPTMTTEDFGYYIDAARGCFYHLGAGCDAALHSPLFLPMEEAAVNGALIHASLISDFLQNMK